MLLGKKISGLLARAFRDAGFNITHEEWMLLSKLASEGGQPQVAFNCSCSDRHYVSRLISKLESEHLVCRSPHKGVSKMVYLTPDGVELTRKLTGIRNTLVHDIATGIPTEDIETFQRVLAHLSEKLDAITTRCPKEPEKE